MDEHARHAERVGDEARVLPAAPPKQHSVYSVTS
jgi:hypothetical protein